MPHRKKEARRKKPRSFLHRADSRGFFSADRCQIDSCAQKVIKKIASLTGHFSFYCSHSHLGSHPGPRTPLGGHAQTLGPPPGPYPSGGGSSSHSAASNPLLSPGRAAAGPPQPLHFDRSPQRQLSSSSSQPSVNQGQFSPTSPLSTTDTLSR